MWSFYLNGGIEAVLQHLCRDGLQRQTPDGMLHTLHTIIKTDTIVEAIFSLQDGTMASRQILNVLPDKTILVSYYASDNKHPYLTYHCRPETDDVIHLKRTTWTKKKEIVCESKVIVTSRNQAGHVISYGIPEAEWNVALTYDEKGLLAREEIESPNENGVITYEWNAESVPILQRFKITAKDK